MTADLASLVARIEAAINDMGSDLPMQSRRVTRSEALAALAELSERAERLEVVAEQARWAMDCDGQDTVSRLGSMMERLGHVRNSLANLDASLVPQTGSSEG